VHKAEKANEHAQHEAAEACKRQQRAAAKAQQKIDAAYQHGTHEIDEATAKVNKRYSEWTDEYAKLNSLTGPNEATAQEQPQTQPEPESGVTRTKPAPTPEATPETPMPPQVTPAPTPEVTPPAPPTPESKVEQPKELPKTAGSLDLLGLIGLVSSSGSYLMGSIRRQF
jgi:hypothetical protein